MKRPLTIFFFIGMVCCPIYAVNIVPLPYYVKLTGKNFTLQKDINYEKIISEEEYPQLKSFYIGICNQNKTFDAFCQKIGFYQQDIGKEGYELLIDNNKIVLAANTPQGLFYGKQSLIQLIRGSAKNNQMQGLHIIDKPALKYRGVMDDISRGPVPDKEYMKYQIRRMSELKLNMLCYYTEHIVHTKKHPEFAPPAGGITIEEWKEIAEYARKHYIELVPNFQSLGHAEKVLLNPKYRYLGESNSMYAPTNPETALFMKDIYDEMCPAFDSDFFHVNCDEAFDLGRGVSKKITDSIGVGRLYANYMNQLSDIIRANNKRMMMWGDMVLQQPDILPLLPSDVVIMTWEYSDNKSYARWIDPFVEKGFDYMICPGVLNSLRLFPDYKQALPTIRKFVREGVRKGAMGMLNTVWDEGGLHTFDRDWYGVAYGAEQSWNPNDNNIDDFDTRLSRGIYKSEDKDLFTAIHRLTDLGEMQALDKMSELTFWKTIIPERGKCNNYSVSGWEEVYEACLEIDSILNRKTAQNYTREYAAFQIVSDEYKYLAQAKLKLSKASSLYSEACCMQYENRNEARQLLVEVRNNMMDCFFDFKKLKKEYDIIWKNESRDYWNNFEMDRFDRVLDDYADMITSFDKSIQYFEENQPLSAPADIRIDIREQKGSYFTYWLISPAFNPENGITFDNDFLEGMGGEQNASPFPGFSFFNAKGQNIKWIKYSSPFFDRVPLNAALEAKDKAISYAFCILESPDDRVVTASMGVEGGIELFCNGVSALKKFDNKTLLIDEFQCQINLKQGKNRLLLKIQKDSNIWDFSFSIKEATISNSKNKYRIN
jgi:hypothetical protein